ncbi:MAG TPA: citrate transporter [Burkholderiales bacterium]|nr:citrate transporter [Burkholderiales bacterium]
MSGSRFALAAALALAALPAFALEAVPQTPGPEIFGVPVEFILFGLTLISVAVFHHYVLAVALSGLTAIVLYKLAFTGFKYGPGLAGFGAHIGHEWVILTNLLCLLVGFAVLARHFEDSRVPEALPRVLPRDWKGGFVLLVLIFVLSGFLDNIAAALIGATVAGTVFRQRVHIGYLAAIVAASNAGGAGSVVGDTTTTMMWLDGVSPLAVLPAYLPALAALLVFGVPAALQQHRYSPLHVPSGRRAPIDWARIFIVGLILAAAIATNVTVNMKFRHLADSFPFIGAAVWVAILVCVPLRKPHWALVPDAFKGSIFLLALVTCASLMPVEKLPIASWQTSFGLGFLSSVFDNIPLTALALKQGGYDWAMLAYAVGFGGSMMWFGSSAGVAVSNIFPQAKSVFEWVRHGWHVAIGYVVGFIVMLVVLGWNPTDRTRPHRLPEPAAQSQMPAAVQGIESRPTEGAR